MLLSYCVVNTNDRKHLLACLDAIDETVPPGLEHEVLVLDNASEDGSADAVRSRGDGIRLIELDRRAGKAANDSHLLREAKGEFCLLLNEDSELRARRRRRTARCPSGRPRGGGRCAAALAGRQACPVRLAPAGVRHGPRRSAAPAPHGPERRDRTSGRVGAVERDAGPALRRRAGRLARPAVLRLLG